MPEESEPHGTVVLATARRLADEVLFPTALETDAGDTLPAGRLDALAAAGLYGLTGPASAGGPMPISVLSARWSRPSPPVA